MGKGTRNRLYAEKNGAEKQRIEAEKRKKARRERLIMGCFCGMLILAIAGYGGYIGIDKLLEKNGTKMRNVSVITSKKCEINGAMMSYFTYDAYKTFVSQNSANLSNYGLDTTKDIKEQTYKDGETWFDYFYEQAATNAEQFVAFYNAAVADGKKLSDTEKADIEDTLDNIDAADYGTGVKLDDIRDCLEIITLAKDYYTPLTEEFKPDTTEIQTYFDENPQDFQTFSYASYALNPDSFASTEVYNEWRDKLKASTDLDSFKTNLKECLVSACGMSDDEAETALASIVTSDASYNEDDSVSEWAYDSERKLYDTFYEESDDANTIYMLTELPKRNETQSVNARHILFTASNYGSTVKAKKKAQEIYDEYLAGEHTADAFASLAEKHSDDTGSKDTGGLIENITEGQTVAEFNDWCFDASRVNGDTALIKSDYGYHIMYFEGQGLSGWQSSVSTKIIDNKFNDKCDSLKEKYSVKLNKKAQDKLR